MPSIDMPPEQLRQYKPSLYRESDFETFWKSTVAQAVQQPLNAELISHEHAETRFRSLVESLRA
jgi:cephalosporin-C deacetylase-like acetyl esterase